MPPRKSSKNKNPPILSHEFVIQNHADIVSCVAMVFLAGLMFQVSHPVASLFITLQHNITHNLTNESSSTPGPDHDAASSILTLYEVGRKDLLTIFFYSLICIVGHAIIQEYIVDRVNRKLHLSKIKQSKFNESSQLFLWCLASAAFSIDRIIKEDYLTHGMSHLWHNYPHLELTFHHKIFYIIQVSYWIHAFPELYFQKIRKEEISERLTYITLYLSFIAAAYMLNLNRLCLVLLAAHYSSETIYHMARLALFLDKKSASRFLFVLWNVAFIVVRLLSISLATLTIWFGLEASSVDVVDIKTGNFNTYLVRLNSLVALSLLQAWMMWNFITFHLKRRRDMRRYSALGARLHAVDNQDTPSIGGKTSPPSSPHKRNKVTNSDQNGSMVRQRKGGAGKQK